MRPIKFRGRRIDSGKLVYGSLVVGTEKKAYYIFTQDEIAQWNVNPETVGQYTGLQDKNGIHDLYEGDIINVNGLKVGNVYETTNVHECTTNHIIAGMGTAKWKDTEQEAIKRGCFYAE